MHNLRPPLILIAADDQAVCEALEFALRLEGLSVRTHREAAALMNDRDLVSASCIIVDDRKPHLDGFDLLGRIRSLEQKMPVILLTNHASKRLRLRAADAGIQFLLEKPLLNNVLLDSLHTILGELAGCCEGH